jgi:hypothetical protein
MVMIRKTATSLCALAACAAMMAAAPIAVAQGVGPNPSYNPPPPAMNAPGPANTAPMNNPTAPGPMMTAPQADLVTNGPQADTGDASGMRAAQRNVRESHEYDRLLQMNPQFRAARIRKECGPITDAQLHASCVASFGQDEPYYGSSTAPNQPGRAAGE